MTDSALKGQDESTANTLILNNGDNVSKIEKKDRLQNPPSPVMRTDFQVNTL